MIFCNMYYYCTNGFWYFRIQSFATCVLKSVTFLNKTHKCSTLGRTCLLGIVWSNCAAVAWYESAIRFCENWRCWWLMGCGRNREGDKRNVGWWDETGKEQDRTQWGGLRGRLQGCLIDMRRRSCSGSS